VASWSLQNVLPNMWKGPALNATSREVALETLELVHEGFL
jgi:phage tail-like protein